MPAVCAGSVAEAPLALPATMKPAVWKVVLQMLAGAQLLPLAQHWRAPLAATDSADSVTATTLPSVAVG